jgi:hypothetical protein
MRRDKPAAVFTSMPCALAHLRTSTAFRSPAGPAGSIDVPDQCIPQFLGVPGIQVDLIPGAAQSEADGALGGAAVEGTDEQRLYLLSHGRPGPLTAFSALVYAL